MKVEIPDLDLSTLGRFLVDIVYGFLMFTATTMLCYVTTMTLIAHQLQQPKETTHEQTNPR